MAYRTYWVWRIGPIGYGVLGYSGTVFCTSWVRRIELLGYGVLGSLGTAYWATPVPLSRLNTGPTRSALVILFNLRRFMENAEKSMGVLINSSNMSRGFLAYTISLNYDYSRVLSKVLTVFQSESSVLGLGASLNQSFFGILRAPSARVSSASVLSG
ncbi:hypothetical protein Tco_0227384 [Tanacetum coccineum]